MVLQTGIAFQVTASDVGEVPFSGPSAFESEVPLLHAMSFLLHAGVLGALSLFMPAMSIDDSETIHREQILMMQHLLESSGDSHPSHEASDQAGMNDPTSASATAGAPQMGNPEASKSHSRYAVAGPQDNADPHLARLAALREAADFGMLTLLGANAGDPNAPIAPWGRESVLGNDEASARANMWGDTIGDSRGVGGIGLSGIGEVRLWQW